MNHLLTRRQMLAKTGTGFGLLALADLFARAEDPRLVLPHHAPKAKRCIFLYMPGGPSQMDLFDPKPRVLADHGKPLPFETEVPPKAEAPNRPMLLILCGLGGFVGACVWWLPWSWLGGAGWVI